LEALIEGLKTKPDMSDRMRLDSVREARGLIRLLAKLRGEESPKKHEIRLLESNQWQRLQNAIIKALVPFPEALSAVERALTNLDDPEAEDDREEALDA
jgi:hypothetical protein